ERQRADPGDERREAGGGVAVERDAEDDPEDEQPAPPVAPWSLARRGIWVGRSCRVRRVQRAVCGGLIQLEAYEEADRRDDAAGDERDAPAPGVDGVLGQHPDHEGRYAGPEQESRHGRGLD